MLTMGMDTALSHCSVAIMSDDQVLAENCVPLSRGHAEQIGPMVRDACALADVCVLDFDRIGVVIGPGSFAGVRVGLGFARGLRIDGGPQIVGISSLQALALGQRDLNEKQKILAVIDARQGYYYAAVFDYEAKEILPPFIGDRDSIAAATKGGQLILCGPAARDFLQLENIVESAPANSKIDVKQIARLCIDQSSKMQNASPLYLRPPDAVRKKSGRFLALNDD